nr:leucine-rich repeat-containing protein 49 [Danio rerio]|eukprot:XP_009291631.2 leucine-rich repeat-containing protein 49 [Danio rerio]
MRSSKQRKCSSSGRFLPSAVHSSYKQHLAAVSSLLPDRLSRRPLDLRLSTDLKNTFNVDALKTQPCTSGETGSLRDSSVPNFLSATSFRDDISSCPERLDLDRRGLTDLPDLQSLHELRQLNLQHNLITHLQHLQSLRSLLLLDLHGNRLIDMCGLSSLRCLRVLLLGNNRIQRISDVDGLTKLDVLDLHNNQVHIL